MNFADTITRHARERPYAVAIIDNDLVMHYRDLEAVVWAAAAHLRQSGIRPGEVVGIALPHSTAFLVAMLALARIGAVQTPLPTSDPPPVRESYARRFAVKWILAATDDAGLAGVPTVLLPAALAGLRPLGVGELRHPGGEYPFAISRSSGTTSEAKGIIRTHTALLEAYRIQISFFPGPDDRLLAVVDMALTYGIRSCERTFLGGGTVIVAPMPLTGEMLLDLIDRYGVTRLALTPYHLDALLPLLPQDACRCPSVVDVSVTGMAMPESLRSEIRRRFSRGLIVKYSSNEASWVAAADAAMQEQYPETVGAVLPGVELEVVDEDDRPVPRGQPGRIRVRAPWTPVGYVNAASGNDRTFRDGWLYMGDIGVLTAQGMLFIRGREDDMMNFDGIKIMPADIEDTLLRHPAVVEAAAFPASSPRHQNVPMAAVTVRQPVSGDALIDWCRGELGMRAPVLISIEPALPKNAMGKIVKKDLAERLATKLPPRLR